MTAPRVLVVGSGLAGLSCALRLARAGLRVQVVSPGEAGSDGATHRIHALAPWILVTAPWLADDDPALFFRQLLKRSRGLVRKDLLQIFTEEALPTANELVDLLGLIPIDDGPTQLPGCERKRAMRFRPERPKRPILAPLLAACRESGVELHSHNLTVSLLWDGDSVTGATTFETTTRERKTYPAEAVVLATGGIGAVFPLCTEPRWCRGSALALAGPVGAELYHPHLSQSLPVHSASGFFPSTRAVLDGRIEVDGKPLPAMATLEQATLRIAQARREGYRPILRPSIAKDVLLQEQFGGADDGFELRIALHQGLGGISTDVFGRSSVPGLYACGEAAGGAQGRTRSMGTGLLEARIFGKRAAEGVLQDLPHLTVAVDDPQVEPTALPEGAPELNRELDEWLEPLTCIRPHEEVRQVIAELESWPERDEEGAGDSKGSPATWLTDLRRKAALAIFSAELET